MGREQGPSSLPMALKIPWPGSSVALLLPCFQGSWGGAQGLLSPALRDGTCEQQSPGPHQSGCSWAAGAGQADRECLSNVSGLETSCLHQQSLISLCVKASVCSSCAQEL